MVIPEAVGPIVWEGQVADVCHSLNGDFNWQSLRIILGAQRSAYPKKAVQERSARIKRPSHCGSGDLRRLSVLLEFY